MCGILCARLKLTNFHFYLKACDMKPFWLLLAVCWLTACGGGGSGGGIGNVVKPEPDATQPAVVPVAKLVLPTSYQNFKVVGLTPQDLPGGLTGVGVVRAYADFSGQGRLDLFAASLTYDPWRPVQNATPSRLEFWRKQADGSFERDEVMLSSDQGCIHPRRAIVADFNADQRPDVFLACHGYDADPYPGERNWVVLSQPNGRYEVKQAGPDVGFFHSASAADLNGDGLPDVVVTNSSDPAVVYALINKGKGVFEREPRARFPASLREKGLYTVELLDVNEDGRLDVLVGGHEWGGTSTVLLLNPGNNQFADVTPIILPPVPGEGVVLDFAVTGTGASRSLWALRTSGGDGTFYQSRTIQKITWPGLASTTPWLQRNAPWFAWLIPAVVNGRAVMTSEDASVGVSVPQ
jgi:hypothetical protein